MKLTRKKTDYETGRILSLPIDKIVPNPNQPRRFFSPEELQELANSIRELGILQPLSVRPLDQGWELIAGERRLRASRLAGLTHVPCIVFQTSEEHSSLLALVENLQRRDLDFWEEALALDQLIRTYSLSQEECARRIGKSQSAIANKLRLLKLPEHILDLLRDNGFTERHARALLKISDASLRGDVLRHIIDRHLNVSATEAYIEEISCELARYQAKKEAEQQHLRRQETVCAPSLEESAHPAPVRHARLKGTIKDMQLFYNSLQNALNILETAGIRGNVDKTEHQDEIVLTITLSKREAV